jgi:hypothetical protein
MKISIPFINEYQIRCKFFVSFLIITCLAFLPLSCNDIHQNSGSDSSEFDELSVSEQNNPNAVLSSGNMYGTLSSLAKRPNTGNSGGFSGPIFGLTTAPNGEILVADAGAGIATMDGRTDIQLPGVSDMSPIGRGTMWAIEGLTGAPGDNTGQALYRATRGENHKIADLFAFEETFNPDGADIIDSNPFDVHTIDGETAVVADAGANDLLKIDKQGSIDVLAVFPDELVSTENIKELVGCPESGADLCALPDMMPAQPVPTSIAMGPDGYIYVGELKGFPAPTGASSVWRIAPDASWAECGSSPDCVKVFDGGFTSIIDMAFDANGNLHIAELDENSWFAVEIFGHDALTGGTINSCDVETLSCTEVATGIPILTAITFGSDGTLWATKNSLIPDLAEVIRIE